MRDHSTRAARPGMKGGVAMALGGLSLVWMRRLAVALVLAPCAHAWASPTLELLGDTTGEGGLAGRYGAASAGSTYFNPALLSAADARFDLGVVWLGDRIDIELAPRPADADVALEAAGAFRSDGDLTPVFPPPVPTVWLEEGCADDCESRFVDDPALARPRGGVDSSDNDLGYLAVGLVNPLVDDRLVLGVYVLLPLSELTGADSFYNDEREQYFGNSLHPELYSDRLSAPGIAFGFGSRVFGPLRLGVSFTLNLDNRADAPTFVPDAANYEQLRISNDVSVRPSLAPHFGAALDVTDDLQLTATLHTVQSLELEARFGSFLPDGSDMRSRQRFTHHYVPWSGSLGASYRFKLPGDSQLLLIAGVSYSDWSSYRDRHDEPPTPAWVDTLTPVVGARYRVAALSLGVDATYVTSPVPEQVGRRNYVDNDRLGFAALGHHDFELGALSLRAGLHARLSRLLPEEHAKRMLTDDDADPVRDEVPDDAVQRTDIDVPVEPRDGLQTNNPGFPGFASEGWLMAAGLSLSLLLP